MKNVSFQLKNRRFFCFVLVPFLKGDLKLKRVCIFVPLLFMSNLACMAQETSAYPSEYICESSPAPVYEEIMRDMQETDYTALYRYVARQMHKPMKELIFIPIFSADEPADLTTSSSSFISGLHLTDLAPEEAIQENWLSDWESFGLFEKWKFPQYRKRIRKYHYASAVAVYDKDGLLLNVYLNFRHKLFPPDGGIYIDDLSRCSSANFFLTIGSSLFWYLFFEDASHYCILGRCIESSSFVPSSYERFYDELLLNNRNYEEQRAKRIAEKAASHQ